MDYSRASRSFYAELKSKNNSIESFGPIRNELGQLSTNLHGCLINWASYYKKLYTSTLKYGPQYSCPRSDRHPLLNEMRSKQLNAEISTSETIYAINTLKDYSTPGKDMLLSRDFTILLHIEEGKKSADYPESWVVIDFLREVLAKFWTSEKVPQNAKETVLRPFLKSLDQDPTNPEYYRPIALLSTVRKIYEQILKKRLPQVLEETDFF